MHCPVEVVRSVFGKELAFFFCKMEVALKVGERGEGE